MRKLSLIGMEHRTFKSGWIFLMVLAIIVAMVLYSGIDVKPAMTSSIIGFHMQAAEDLHISNVQTERWIVVDGSNIPEEQLVQTEDVPGWRILVFGKNSNIFRNKRCSNCIALSAISPLIGKHTFSSLTNQKMTSYLYAISHGAKWIFVTSHIVNLKGQVEVFHTEERLKGLLYTGQVIFDPDRHFGVKDISVNRTVRTNQLSYKLGEYATPSVQSIWRLPAHVTGTNKFDVNDVACRLPHVIIPPQLFPGADLMGSVIEYRSFWILGGLLSDLNTSSLVYWWLLLMRDVNEIVGQYPPLWGSADTFVNNGGTAVPMPNTLSGWKCASNNSFFTCGLLLAKEMGTHGLITQSDVLVIKQWIGLLNLFNFKEPKRNNSLNVSSTGGVHNVALETMSKPYSKYVENPFKKICKLQLQDTNMPKPLPPIRDILLVIIFNFPTLYSNILYLDDIYRTFFTNILYCGVSLDMFSQFQQNYSRPVSFLELSEVENTRGKFGYLCSAYAMEMGFRVGGYLQMSDDVVLNMWNIISLPRDTIWFQSSIRKGKLSAPEVPNVTTINGKIWMVWTDKKVGVRSLRSTWSHLTNLKKSQHKSKVESFFKQLATNFGNKTVPGAFYEASDIFYTPTKYKDNFSFFSKQCYHKHLHLEICVPTMLCGFDDISNIVRLPGTYLWYAQRKNYTQYYNPKHIFLHPWKLKELFTQAEAQNFFCTKYYPYLEGRNN